MVFNYYLLLLLLGLQQEKQQQQQLLLLQKFSARWIKKQAITKLLINRIKSC